MTKIENGPFAPGWVRALLAEQWTGDGTTERTVEFAVWRGASRGYVPLEKRVVAQYFHGPALVLDHEAHDLALHTMTVRARLLDGYGNELDSAEALAREFADDRAVYAWWCMTKLQQEMHPDANVGIGGFTYTSDGVLFEVFDFHSERTAINAWCWNPVGGWAYTVAPLDINHADAKDRIRKNRVQWHRLPFLPEAGVGDAVSMAPAPDHFVDLALSEIHDNAEGVPA